MKGDWLLDTCGHAIGAARDLHGAARHELGEAAYTI